MSLQHLYCHCMLVIVLPQTWLRLDHQIFRYGRRTFCELQAAVFMCVSHHFTQLDEIQVLQFCENVV
jgi:hypothetical protein